MNSALSLRNLVVQRGHFTLGPVSLEVEAGRYLVLLGPTGCGKTTLLRAIIGSAGFFPGRIWVQGEDIGRLPLHRRQLGYVSQVNDLFPHLTVAENIAFGLRYQKHTPGELRRRVDEFLDWFNLAGQARQIASTLSGGESKKAALARSLITGPRLLLLDEPLGMLDHNERRDLLGWLKTIHTRLKTTTIHVTHDRREAWGIGDAGAVMARGRILQSGSVAELFRKPRSRAAAEFTGGTNIFAADFSQRTARVSWGRLALKNRPPFQQGYVCLRPEQIALNAPGPVLARGRVVQTQDYGDYCEVLVRLQPVAVTLSVHTDVLRGKTLKTGSLLKLTWAPDAVQVLPGEDPHV